MIDEKSLKELGFDELRGLYNEMNATDPPELRLRVLNYMCRKIPNRGAVKDLEYIISEMKDVLDGGYEGLEDEYGFYLIKQADLAGRANDEDKAFAFLKQAESMHDSLKRRTRLGLYNTLGIKYLNYGIFHTAVSYFTRLIETVDKEYSEEEKQDIDRLYMAGFQNVGICYAYEEDMANALKYFERAYRILKEKKLYKNPGYFELWFTALTNSFRANLHLAKNEKAKEYLDECERSIKGLSNKHYTALFYFAKAEYEYRTGDLDEAEKTYNRVLELNHESHPSKNLNLLNSLIDIHLKKGDDNKAQLLLQQAVKVIEDQAITLESIPTWEQLSQQSIKQNDYKKAYECMHKVSQLKDQRKVQKVNEALRNLEIKQTEIIKEKEIEIERLKNTELKSALEALKTAQEELVESEKLAAIGNIASRIAHEVQNPLNFINNFSSINVDLLKDLEESLELNDANKETLEILKQNSAKIEEHGKRVADSVGKLRTDYNL